MRLKAWHSAASCERPLWLFCCSWFDVAHHTHLWWESVVNTNKSLCSLPSLILFGLYQHGKPLGWFFERNFALESEEKKTDLRKGSWILYVGACNFPGAWNSWIFLPHVQEIALPTQSWVYQIIPLAYKGTIPSKQHFCSSFQAH